MSFMPVILWSDALVFLLLAAAAAMTWYVRVQEHLLLPWRREAKSSVAMVSLLVLSIKSVFTCISLAVLSKSPLVSTSGGSGGRFSCVALSCLEIWRTNAALGLMH